jgi:hypothetical protein
MSELEQMDIYSKTDTKGTRLDEIKNIISLVKLLPNKNWNWRHLSSRCDVEIEMILSHPELPWNWDEVSRHPHLLFSHLDSLSKAFPDKKWNFFNLSKHHNFSLTDIFHYPQLPWDDEGLSKNPNINIYIVESHPERKWNYDSLTYNSGISLYDIYSFDSPWNTALLSYNLSITPKQIDLYLASKKQKKIVFDWNIMSVHPNVSIAFITTHPKLKWNFKNLSQNSNLTIDFVLSNKDRDWDWEELSCHPNISFKTILKHPELPWVWNCVMVNPSITFSDVISHPEILWNYRQLSRAITMSFQELYNNQHLDWDWEELSQNTNLMCSEEKYVFHEEHQGVYIKYCTDIISKVQEQIEDMMTASVCFQKPISQSMIQKYKILSDLVRYPFSHDDTTSRFKMYMRNINGFFVYFHRGRFQWMALLLWDSSYPQSIREELIKQLYTKYEEYINPTLNGILLNMNGEHDMTLIYDDEGKNVYKTYLDVEKMVRDITTFLNEHIVV